MSSADVVIQQKLQTYSFGPYLLRHVPGTFSLTAALPGLLTISTRFIEALIIILVSDAYLAAQPALYRSGVIRPFPPCHRARAAEIFDGIAAALRLWLLGQLFEMVLIGVLSTFAVWLIGVPSPHTPGLIPGIGESFRISDRSSPPSRRCW